MQLPKQEVSGRARRDLARRLNVDESEIVEQSADEDEFPDAALGAPTGDEMSAQIITPGWRIVLSANGKTFEYRGTVKQLRLVNFNGENYRI